MRGLCGAVGNGLTTARSSVAGVRERAVRSIAAGVVAEHVRWRAMTLFLSFILQRVPGLSKEVGRRRFERFVGPLPSNVSAVSARFDLNITRFRFDSPFERNELLKSFEVVGMENWLLHGPLLAKDVGRPTRQFYRWVEPTPVWLYLNDEDCRGVVLAI